MEDNENSRLVLKKILEHNNYSVEVSFNGADALEKIKASPPEMIISDILMPVMDGFILCNKVKSIAQFRDIPFIFYTSTYIDPKDERLAADLGASRYIVKPVESNVLLKAIKDVAKEQEKKMPSPSEKSKYQLYRLYEESLARKLQKKVRELKLYRNIFTHCKDSIIVTDTNGYCIEQNSSHQLLVGYSDEDLCGKTPEIYWGSEMFSNIFKELSDKGTYRGELTSRTKSGSLINIELSAFPILTDESKVICYVGIGRDITGRKQAEKALKNALMEVNRLKNRLQEENIYLQNEIKLEHNFEEIISCSESFKHILRKIEKVASTSATVLVLGESGTGKELIARAIHSTSDRKNRPLLKVNCATLPENMIESELFGHEKGAFTGAVVRRTGRFELANGGTIFLDEIGELPIGLQAKLLRILQDGEFERLGSSRTIKVDVRIIAATNRVLENAIKTGDFRSDLYYRLNVFPIKIIPLRERREDIPLLVGHFVKIYCKKMGKKIVHIKQRIMDSLQEYHWPGNVRELENIIERAIILTNGNELELDEQFTHSAKQQEQTRDFKTLKEAEEFLIRKTLEECHWVVGGKNGAALRLNIPTTTLRERIIKYGIKKP